MQRTYSPRTRFGEKKMILHPQQPRSATFILRLVSIVEGHSQWPFFSPSRFAASPQSTQITRHLSAVHLLKGCQLRRQIRWPRQSGSTSYVSLVSIQVEVERGHMFSSNRATNKNKKEDLRGVCPLKTWFLFIYLWGRGGFHSRKTAITIKESGNFF